MVAPSTRGLEDYAAGALRRVGQLSCQERELITRLKK